MAVHAKVPLRSFVIGEGTLTVRCCDFLLRDNHQLLGLIASSPSLVRWVAAHGVRLIDPAENFLAVLQQQPFDYLFSIVNLKLLAKEVIAQPRGGTINFHDGPLPC